MRVVPLPIFVLKGWVARPAGLDAVAEEVAFEPVQQPVRKAAPKPVEVVEDDEIF